MTSIQGGMSLNHYTPKDKCSVKYYEIDHAIFTTFIWQNQVTGEVYYAKTDLKSAFHILGLLPLCFQWLVMKCENPFNGKIAYFVDKCLPFGASISCSHFQRFSNALRYILEFQLGMEAVTTNYLDDFLFVSPTRAGCNRVVRWFLSICKRLGVHVAKEKTEWATQKITFLGMLLDGQRFRITVPQEKRRKALTWLNLMLDKKKAKVKELERLAGLLNFLNRAIVPGRVFTRRMYAKFSNLNLPLRAFGHQI